MRDVHGFVGRRSLRRWTSRLGELRQWAEAATWREVAGLIDVRLSGFGLINGKLIVAFLHRLGITETIESYAKAYAAISRWLIAPKHPPLGVRRRYRPVTLVLETEFQTETGRAVVINFMSPSDGADLVRIVMAS